MKKILLTTDFSDNAKNAIRYAINLFGSEVEYTLLNAYNEPTATSTVIVSISDVLYRESVEGLAQSKEEILAEFGEDLNLVTMTKHGSLFGIILQLTGVMTFDYVVIGSKGASGLEKFIVGSNTLDVIKRVKLPTIVVPSGYVFSGLSAIAYASDYQQLSTKSVLEPLVTLAKMKNAQVHTLHVDAQEILPEEATGKAVELQEVFAEVPHRISNVQNDIVADGISNYTAENSIELLAVLSHKHGFIDRLFHRSVSREISQFSQIPVLVLHE